MTVCGPEQAVHHFRSAHCHQPLETSIRPALAGRSPVVFAGCKVVSVVLRNTFKAEPALAGAARPEPVYCQSPRNFVAGNQQVTQHLDRLLRPILPQCQRRRGPVVRSPTFQHVAQMGDLFYARPAQLCRDAPEMSAFRLVVGLAQWRSDAAVWVRAGYVFLSGQRYGC